MLASLACLPCVSGSDPSDEFTPEVIQRLYHRCLKSNNGRLIVYGLFARANAVNTNNRLYPKRVLQREVRKFAREQVEAQCALGELDHPSYSAPTFKHLNLANISHQVLSLKWKGNAVWGFIEVLDTPSGRLVRDLYARGCKLGVSSRGWASLHEMPGKRYKCIMCNFELITFDFVTEPSTCGAWLLPWVSPYGGTVPSQALPEQLSRFGCGAVPPAQLGALPPLPDLESSLRVFVQRLQEQPAFTVNRMLGPAQWRVSSRRSKKRNEPAATDSGATAVPAAICRRMASGMPCARAAAAAAMRPPPEGYDALLVPVSPDNVLVYDTPAQVPAPIAYGAYVVHAALYGVPQLCGLRDYWRHAYLFRERAVRAAFGAPAPTLNGSAASATHGSAAPAVPPSELPAAAGAIPDVIPDVKSQLRDEQIVVTGGLAPRDGRTDSLASAASSAAATPTTLSGNLRLVASTTAALAAAPGDTGVPVCSGVRAASAARLVSRASSAEQRAARGQGEAAASDPRTSRSSFHAPCAACAQARVPVVAKLYEESWVGIDRAAAHKRRNCSEHTCHSSRRLQSLQLDVAALQEQATQAKAHSRQRRSGALHDANRAEQLARVDCSSMAQQHEPSAARCARSSLPRCPQQAHERAARSRRLHEPHRPDSFDV